jgi:biotin synthase
LCFFAGANSIFYGDKLLTAKNPSVEKDQVLLAKLGLSPLAPIPAKEAAARAV